jgi:hypothetical protein
MRKLLLITSGSLVLLAQQWSCKSNTDGRSDARETRADSQSQQKALNPEERYQLVAEKLRAAMAVLKPTNAGGRAQLMEVYDRLSYPKTTTANPEIKEGAPCNASKYNLPVWGRVGEASKLPVAQGADGKAPPQDCVTGFIKNATESIVGMQWYGATSKEFSRNLREYLPNGQVRFDLNNLTIVLGEGVTEAAAKTDIEGKLQAALAGVPAVQVSLLPTVHFHETSGAALCISHSLFVSRLASMPSVKLDGPPVKDSNVPGGFIPSLAYLSRPANTGSKPELAPFLRQDFVAAVFSSRNMAYSKLGFAPVFSDGTAVDLDAYMSEDFELTCEGAPNNQCVVLRGVDIKGLDQCPIMSLMVDP